MNNIKLILYGRAYEQVKTLHENIRDSKKQGELQQNS